ncbi:tetratricopeptide repeat protein [Mariniradius sediminis]|uniref:Tetratricopeptide repeat protein n=1 Tax=Mariniradius sediminis TaxID=2909237 RepID=A0ABS9BW20_9BACT|nr:tetratricopeptide repeat protein [Mariniradius sediminis]MCF1751371.1 tetratricopeptide repeat protein [Mariniradius sediminis]
MTINFNRSDFFNKLFPEVDATNDAAVRQKLAEFYHPIKVKILIEGDKIVVELQDTVKESKSNDFYRATDLCAKKRYQEAIPIFHRLIEENPTDSEYHRNLAQAYEESGDHETAINHLIDALKWNPSNHWALILMGNIYVRYFNDLSTAMAYFDQVVETDPKNYVALNNIGGTFLQSGKLTLAERYLSKAYVANAKFPNVTLGLAIVNFQKGDFRTSFGFAIESLRNEEQVEGQVHQKALQLALESSKSLINQNVGKESLVDYIQEIENLTGKDVRIEEDPTISTAAKVEYAENYGRDFHLVKTNPKYPNTDHLIAHELTHLKLAEEARKVGVNKLFIGNDGKLDDFRKTIRPSLKNLEKRGVPEASISKYSQDLFQGILGQVFNTPLDLFIEDYLFNHFPELRFVQFHSLYQMNVEAHKAVNDPKIIELSPPNILTKSRIFNVVSARHFESLFGVKMEKTFTIRPFEKEQVDAFWDEFNEYRNDRKPGEEYELVQHWGEDLELDSYFELVDESAYRSKGKPSTKTPEDVLNAIEQDPFQQQGFDEDEEEELGKFQEQHAGKDINMAVAMYMAGALGYFKDMSKDKVKEIALEVAMLGRTGINPQKKGYKLNKIPGTTFSGYKLLAYYYVSWAIAIPEMLKDLQMPFEKEFELAKKISS